MNVFETIGRVSSRREPYHSQFLADALKCSLATDRTLFDALWKLAAPPDWKTPHQARVSAEEVVERGRIDICIISEQSHQRVLGIEVKTDEGSASLGQLEKYHEGLKEKYGGYDVSVSYLTPFNRDKAGDAAASLPTVRIFQQFVRIYPNSRHLSWLDVASIPWDENELWKQHQAYVRNHISSLSELQDKRESNRRFADFFGKEVADRFSARLSELGINGTNVNLGEFMDDPSFAKSLAAAFEILLQGTNVARHSNRKDKFPAEHMPQYLDSDFGQIHKAILELSERFNFVWVEGKKNYGIRTAHRKHSGGVSMLTSDGPGRLTFGRPR